MRTYILSSLAALFAAFAQFAAVLGAFALPVSAIADQPANTVEVVVEIRQAI